MDEEGNADGHFGEETSLLRGRLNSEEQPHVTLLNPTKASNWITFIHLTNVLLGLGLLSLPFAYSRLGFLGAILVSFLFSATALWTANLVASFPSMVRHHLTIE